MLSIRDGGEFVFKISSNIDKRNITKTKINCEVIKQFLVFVFHSDIMMRSEITKNIHKLS